MILLSPLAGALPGQTWKPPWPSNWLPSHRLASLAGDAVRLPPFKGDSRT